MNEFLTENVRRAYPLAEIWPAGFDERWSGALVDASISTNGVLGPTETISLLAVKKDGRSLIFRLGLTASDCIEVPVAEGLSGFTTVYAATESYKAFLTINGQSVDGLIADTGTPTEWASVNRPFALRCVSSAIRRVTSVSAYSPTLCEKPVFVGNETPVRTVTGGHLVLAVKDGLDLETTTQPPLAGEILRLSAITAPADTAERDSTTDLMIRGDECFTVETLPGVKEVDGVLVPRTEADTGGILGGGVIRLGTSCKPCCQCEDYRDAVDSLRPAETEASRIKGLLDSAKEQYDEAIAAFNAAKASALSTINDYPNVHTRAVSSTSGGVYGGSTAPGTRKRITVTVLAENMTLSTAQVTLAASAFSVPGYTRLKTYWQTADANNMSGESLPVTVSLGPGGTLSVAATFTLSSSGLNANDAVLPDGSTVCLSVALPGKQSETRTVPIT